jgi:hypothetical protein
MSSQEIIMMLLNFGTNYPQTTEFVSTELSDIKYWNKKTILLMIVNVSVLMSKLKERKYNKYLKDSSIDIPIEWIDMFGKTYLRNFKNIVEIIYQTTGDTIISPKVTKSLEPDNFIVKLINQTC